MKRISNNELQIANKARTIATENKDTTHRTNKCVWEKRIQCSNIDPRATKLDFELSRPNVYKQLHTQTWSLLYDVRRNEYTNCGGDQNFYNFIIKRRNETYTKMSNSLNERFCCWALFSYEMKYFLCIFQMIILLMIYLWK